mgnify:CR=1 FL=1
MTGRKTPYHIFPAIPNMDRDFVELISSKRFKDSVEKVRMAMGDTRIIQGQNALMQLMMTVGQAMQRLVMIQSQNAEELEALAVKLVKEELGIPEGAMQFDAQLVMQPMGAAEGMQSEPEMPSEEEVEELMGDMENFNLERAKRRLINSMVQGSSKKGHYMYQLVPQKIQQITGSQELINQYGVLMSINDTLYWQLSDDTIKGLGGSSAGKESAEGPEEEINMETGEIVEAAMTAAEATPKKTKKAKTLQ